MRTIRIVSGVYGHRPAGNRYTERKRAGDPPFEIEETKLPLSHLSCRHVDAVEEVPFKELQQA